MENKDDIYREGETERDKNKDDKTDKDALYNEM